MKHQCKLRNRVEKMKRGEIFGTQELISLGTYENVRQVLARMAKKGEIKRIGRGLYVRPKINRLVGELLPSTDEVIKKIAKDTKEKICIHGAEALRRLKLSTQVQLKPIYYTTGTTRIMHLGNKNIELRHVSERKIVTDNNIGMAILAMNYLGQRQVSFETLTRIKQVISEDEFNRLLNTNKNMPLWLISLCKKYKEKCGN